MNKIAKILSVVLSVSLVIGVTVAMLVSAFAATAPKLSLNLVEETKDYVKVSINLESGSFTAIDFQVNTKDWDTPDKTTGLTIKKTEMGQAYIDYRNALELGEDPVIAVNNGDPTNEDPQKRLPNGKVSFAGLKAFDVKGAMFVFTFTKSSDKDVTASDFIAEVFSCSDADAKAVTVTVDNKLPVPVEPTKPTTEPTKPTTEPTKPTTEPTKPTTEPTKPTTEPTKPTTEPTKPTTDPTEPSTDPTEPSTDPTEPSTDPTEPTSKADDTTAKADDTTAKADDTTAPAADTTTAASSSDVVNPETGDRLTASAAVVALLAISGAAVVALRKKED